MFLQILLNAIFCVFICKISFFCSKFTTIAKYSWFQNGVFALEKFAKKRISQKAAQFILNRSYSKAFYCRSCHCFWISLGLLFVLFRYQCFYYTFTMSFLLSLVAYLMANGLDEQHLEGMKGDLLNTRNVGANYDKNYVEKQNQRRTFRTALQGKCRKL
jgi:hypothetical protein